MKLAFACLLLMIADAVSRGQGTVTFVNGPGTLVSVGGQGQQSLMTGPRGSFYFALLMAAPGTTQPNQFTFTGLYATNDGAFLGRLFGGSDVAVPGWSAGGFMSFFVAGWSASFGHDWNQQWMNGTFSTTGDFGFSSIATAQSGSPGAPPLASLWLFNPVDGIRTGFDLVTVPEPTTLMISLAGGAAMLCRWRRLQTRVELRRTVGKIERSIVEILILKGSLKGSKGVGSRYRAITNLLIDDCLP